MKTKILIISFLLFFSLLKSQIEKPKNSIIENVSYKSNDLYVITIKKNTMKFGVTKKKPYNHEFYMNSNFFKNSKTPIGEVIIDGKVINHKENYGGFFYTINGNPMISIGNHPKNVEFSSQTKYIGIKNGKVNRNIVDRPLNSQKEYRTLIGKNKNGDLVVIHSSRLGKISMRDICEFGLTRGIQIGLIFDGGSSVDIGLKNHTFKSIPFGKSLIGIDEPPIFIVGNFN